MIYTTLNKIRKHSPCGPGWEKLLSFLGKTKADDEPLSFLTILESNGLSDAAWCCRAAPEYDREWRLYVVFCAREVEHLMENQQSIDAISVAERYANGEATEEELAAARATIINAAGKADWVADMATVKDIAKDVYLATLWSISSPSQEEGFKRLVS